MFFVYSAESSGRRYVQFELRLSLPAHSNNHSKIAKKISLPSSQHQQNYSNKLNSKLTGKSYCNNTK